MGIPSDILDDLCSRFLVNLPEDQKTDPIRVCFQAELAHWFYVDFYCADKLKYPRCKECGVREFIRLIFHHCDFLQKMNEDVDKVVSDWREYKASVPSYGAVLLDDSMEHVILVQGYYAKNSWGFPKGKINENEHPVKCAAREVYEETNFDCAALVEPCESLSGRVGDSLVRLFVVRGAPTSHAYRPRTRNEIRKIQWFRVADLPRSRQDQSRAPLGIHANHFNTASPFVDGLRAWIARQRQPPPAAGGKGGGGANKSAFREFRRQRTRSERGQSEPGDAPPPLTEPSPQSRALTAAPVYVAPQTPAARPKRPSAGDRAAVPAAADTTFQVAATDDAPADPLPMTVRQVDVWKNVSLDWAAIFRATSIR